MKEQRRTRWSVAWLLVVSMVPAALGASSESESDPAAEPKRSVLSERIEVHAEKRAVELETVDPEELESVGIVNLAEALETVPGVAGVRRSRSAVEPVVRGLGWERVQTQVNGLPLYGACPGRMDPPATLLPAASVDEAAVVRGLSSVTLGPGGTGGRVLVSTDHDRGAGAGRETDPWARLSYDGARDGYVGSAGVRGGTDRLDFSVGVERIEQDDYRSADGIEVPAGMDEEAAFLSLGNRPTDDQRWHVGILAKDAGQIDYPSLPMDTDDSETRLYDAGYRYRPSGLDTGLSEVEARVGLATIDHHMSNRRKSNRPALEAETVSNADSLSAGVSLQWVVASHSMIQAGGDFNALERDALRERVKLATGAAFEDHLWPDVSQENLGLFAEYCAAPGRGWHLRAGLRYDDVSSEAAAADDASLQGRTVRENYVRLYGPAAARVDRSESLVSGNFLVSRELGERFSVQAGLGTVERAAGMSERYYAFAPAPNGYVVGNPALEAERKREVSLAATWRARLVEATLALYHYDFDDYIHSTVLERRDMNGDGIDDLIRGFVNVPATLTGGELALLLRPTERLSLPASLAYVRGENDETGSPLAEIPPLVLRVATRLQLARRNPAWVELGAQVVDNQDRIDTSFGEDATPGYSVWHLRGGYRIAGRLDLQLRVDNLFDREYHEHLMREAALPAGDLAAGDEIPHPGRSVSLSARALF